jgi:hypothetical protein
MKSRILLASLGIGFFSLTSLATLQNNRNFAITGAIAQIQWGKHRLGKPELSINVTSGFEYWFNQHFALGADVGMGREGYKQSEFEKKFQAGYEGRDSVNFVLTPGISVTGALSPLSVFVPYLDTRVGIALGIDIPPHLSIVPSLGTLIVLNEHVALDICARLHYRPNQSIGFTLGAVGLRVFL